jgi:alanine dehydrogenase
MKDSIGAVQNAFKDYGMGRVQMPPKVQFVFEQFKGTNAIMPAYIASINAISVKVGNFRSENPKKYNLPAISATIVLLEAESGYPVAVMDGTHITAMRTGAAGAVAAKYLARKNSRIVAIVGAGVQGRAQLLGLSELFKIEEVLVSDIAREARELYSLEMHEKLGVNVKPMSSVEEAVESADIIVTTTPSRKPIVMSEWVNVGCHINAIGADSPVKQELDPRIFKRAKIVVDDLEQCKKLGDIRFAISSGEIKESDIYADIGEIATGRKLGRTSDDEITIFKSTGLAVQDATVAWIVYKLAAEKNIGKTIKLF